MPVPPEILSIIASEQAFLASTLSAEASKASQTARWLSLFTPAAITGEGFNPIVQKAISVENAVAGVITSTANKEVAIAAKVSALNGNPLTLNWTNCCPPTP